MQLILTDVAAEAHETRPAIATFSMIGDSRFELAVSLNLEAAIAGIGSDHKDTQDSTAAPVYNQLRILPARDLRVEFKQFAPSFKKLITLTLNDSPIVFETSLAEIPDTGDIALARISIVTLTGRLPEQARYLKWRLDPILGDSVIRLLKSGTEEISHAEYVLAGETAGPFALRDIAPQSWTQVFRSYLKIGFIHIVPKGLDHILFVLGLFLLSTRVSALLWQVSAFTLAHTVTLGLGSTGAITIPANVVEILIAASIVYVGVENILTNRLHRWRLVVVFGFGLLHGLGFASVLGDIGLAKSHFFSSLIAFNVGVELGQLVVIMAAYLIIGWATHRLWYRSMVSIPASLAIALIASVWVVQRLGLV